MNDDHPPSSSSSLHTSSSGPRFCDGGRRGRWPGGRAVSESERIASAAVSEETSERRTNGRSGAERANDAHLRAVLAVLTLAELLEVDVSLGVAVVVVAMRPAAARVVVLVVARASV
jgi:hypothetical protein